MVEECEYAERCRGEGVDCKYDFGVPDANGLAKCDVRHELALEHVVAHDAGDDVGTAGWRA